MKKHFAVFSTIIFLATTAGAHTIVSTALLPVGGSAGSANLLQVTGALAGPVQGSGSGDPATFETRTFYYWEGDTTSLPSFDQSNWPVVFVTGDLIVEEGITAVVTKGIPQPTGLAGVDGAPLLIDGMPVYFFSHSMFGDMSAATANGIYGTWKGVSESGTQVIPEPGTALLFGLGLFAFGWRRARDESEWID